MIAMIARDDVRRIQRQHETDCRAMYSPRPPKLAPHPRAAMDRSDGDLEVSAVDGSHKS
jgi:hypothetical protein